jgi:hypothetical protein
MDPLPDGHEIAGSCTQHGDAEAIEAAEASAR